MTASALVSWMETDSARPCENTGNTCVDKSMYLNLEQPIIHRGYRGLNAARGVKFPEGQFVLFS